MADGGLGVGVDERALLAALFQGPMLVILLDARGRVVSLNQAAARTWDLPPDLETTGLPVWDLLGRPDAEQSILQMMDAVRADGQAFTYRSYWRRPGGEEIYTQWQGGVLRGPGGDVAHFYGLGVDVTERERDARALAESEDRFRWLASVTNEGIAIHDQGRLLDVNARCRAMFGLPPNAPLPPDIRAFFTAESWRRAMEAVRSGGEEPYEVVGRRVDGEEFPLEVTPHSIEMRGRRVRVAACRDLSRQKAAEAERARFEEGTRRAERLQTLGVLAGGLAHDFNNLLGLVVSYTDLAVDSLPPDSPARADLEEVLDAARRASQITQQLLLFRPDGLPSGEVVSLGEAAAAVHHLVARSLAPRVALELVRGQGTQRVRAASARLEQALVNLLFNARDAIEGRGRITLTTESVTLEAPTPAVDGAIEPGRWAVVRVADTGAGMEPEVVGRVFEPFFTTKPTGPSGDPAEGPWQAGRGTGLGLSMVYGVVAEAGGTSSWTRRSAKGPPSRCTSRRSSTPTGGTRARARRPSRGRPLASNLPGTWGTDTRSSSSTITPTSSR